MLPSPPTVLPTLQAYLAASKALKLDPSSTRARYRLARAQLHLRCYDPALEHLRTVRQQVRWTDAVCALVLFALALAAT